MLSSERTSGTSGCMSENFVLDGNNMAREELLFDKLHETIQLSNVKYWLLCCDDFADPGDPDSPKWDVDSSDDNGMSIEELGKLLAEGMPQDEL